MLNQNDIKQISNVIDERVTKIIDERVPNIVYKIIDERVPKIIDERVPGIVYKTVDNIVENRLSDFAIMVQNGFNEIHEILATKADKVDLERLENKFSMRMDKAEDNIRIIKTQLKLS